MDIRNKRSFYIKARAPKVKDIDWNHKNGRYIVTVKGREVAQRKTFPEVEELMDGLKRGKKL